MLGLDVPIPMNCHECDALGISDVVGLKCPTDDDPKVYSLEKRPDGCPLVVMLPPMKKCPWCGSPAKLVEGNINGKKRVYVRCDNIECMATAPNGTYVNENISLEAAKCYAIQTWNRRSS